jgi:hypothetical protein
VVAREKLRAAGERGRWTGAVERERLRAAVATEKLTGVEATGIWRGAEAREEAPKGGKGGKEGAMVRRLL